VTVFAEVDPDQKERIIGALEKGGHAVGYMGDGVNDAPALHTADVGISVDTGRRCGAAGGRLRPAGAQPGGAGARHHRGARRRWRNTLKIASMATSANFGDMFSVAGASLLHAVPAAAAQADPAAQLH
jgi:Mg2+-importing ATPase